MAPLPVEFFYDYASPFSYLASELLARSLPGAPIEYRPMYLRGLATFAQGVPFAPSKLGYLVNDLRRCAEHAGVEVRIPPAFPINGLHALRGAIAAQRAGCFAAYHAPMFRAAWFAGRDISKKEIVAEIATELGLADVAGMIDDPTIKAQLKADTDAAAARGVFGAPTFFVGNDLFWGHDRLHHVARAAGVAPG